MVLGTSLSRGKGEIFPAGGRWGSRRDQDQDQDQGQLHRETAGVARRAGRGGAAGHAVNPSLGAPRRHPWRRGSRIPTPTTPQTLCRCSRKSRAKSLCRQAWLGIAPALPRPPAKCLGWGCEGSRDPPPHGCGGGAYMDVLAACPVNPHTPARPGGPANRGSGFTALASRLWLWLWFFSFEKKRTLPANSLTHVPLRKADPDISIDVSSGLIRFGQQ